MENKQWRWEPFTIEWDRVVTAVGKKTITVDAPITCAIEAQWGGGEIVKYTDPDRIANIGIENLRGMSDYDRTVRTTNHGNIDRHPYYGEEYYSDENHYWNFILINNARNCWVRDVSALHFGNSLVAVDSGAKWVTVEDCASMRPVARRVGGRRFTYQLRGQLTLVQRCTSHEGRHSFVLMNPTACTMPLDSMDSRTSLPVAMSWHGGFSMNSGVPRPAHSSTICFLTPRGVRSTT